MSLFSLLQFDLNKTEKIIFEILKQIRTTETGAKELGYVTRSESGTVVVGVERGTCGLGTHVAMIRRESQGAKRCRYREQRFIRNNQFGLHQQLRRRENGGGREKTSFHFS